MIAASKLPDCHHQNQIKRILVVEVSPTTAVITPRVKVNLAAPKWFHAYFLKIAILLSSTFCSITDCSADIGIPPSLLPASTRFAAEHSVVPRLGSHFSAAIQLHTASVFASEALERLDGEVPRQPVLE